MIKSFQDVTSLADCMKVQFGLEPVTEVIPMLKEVKITFMCQIYKYLISIAEKDSFLSEKHFLNLFFKKNYEEVSLHYITYCSTMNRTYLRS